MIKDSHSIGKEKLRTVFVFVLAHPLRGGKGELPVSVSAGIDLALKVSGIFLQRWLPCQNF